MTLYSSSTYLGEGLFPVNFQLVSSVSVIPDVNVQVLFFLHFLSLIFIFLLPYHAFTNIFAQNPILHFRFSIWINFLSPEVYPLEFQ